jgi:UDP-3-O-[3-hydroxymyristoyl] N-acetylglucosamine deacetylase
VRFHRTDVGALIPATAENAGRFDHATTLGAGGHQIGTVEHFLSATAGLGVDNVLVDVDGPELPILDGSAAPWVRALREAGIVRQSATVNPFVPSRSIVINEAARGRRIEIRPARELRITYTIDFAHPVIGRQSLTVVPTPDLYAQHIAPARTFGFLSEYETLKAHGLARGADVHNCIVLGTDRVESGELRFPDEFVRHKVLDLIGDLALVGRPVLGHVIVLRGGHSLHASLAYALRQEAVAVAVDERVPVSAR